MSLNAQIDKHVYELTSIELCENIDFVHEAIKLSCSEGQCSRNDRYPSNVIASVSVVVDSPRARHGFSLSQAHTNTSTHPPTHKHIQGIANMHANFHLDKQDAKFSMRT